jgi:hypothetical protein
MKKNDSKPTTSISITNEITNIQKIHQHQQQQQPTRNNIFKAFFVYTIFSTPLIILVTMPLSIANYAYIVRNEIILTTTNFSFGYNRTNIESSLYKDCINIFNNFIPSANKATLYLPVSLYSLIIFLIFLSMQL